MIKATHQAQEDRIRRKRWQAALLRGLLKEGAYRASDSRPGLSRPDVQWEEVGGRKADKKNRTRHRAGVVFTS